MNDVLTLGNLLLTVMSMALGGTVMALGFVFRWAVQLHSVTEKVEAVSDRLDEKIGKQDLTDRSVQTLVTSVSVLEMQLQNHSERIRSIEGRINAADR